MQKGASSPGGGLSPSVRASTPFRLRQHSVNLSPTGASIRSIVYASRGSHDVVQEQVQTRIWKHVRLTTRVEHESMIEIGLISVCRCLHAVLVPSKQACLYEANRA